MNRHHRQYIAGIFALGLLLSAAGAAGQGVSIVLSDAGLGFSDGSVQSTAATPGAALATGQVSCWDTAGAVLPCTDTGQDGDLRPGVKAPSPRLTDNGDGTVTDNRSGLIWLQDASCSDLAGTDAEGLGSWATALAAANGLADGICGLSDSSAAGAWRLPSRFELESLVSLELFQPAIPNTLGSAKCDYILAPTECPFTGIATSDYWTSTTVKWDPGPYTSAWRVNLLIGGNGINLKTDALYIWPVRGGR